MSCALWFACWLGAAGIHAAPVAFPLAATTARLNGIPLGKPLHPSSLNSLRFTVA
jgi:hypothetical protein